MRPALHDKKRVKRSLMELSLIFVRRHIAEIMAAVVLVSIVALVVLGWN